MKKEIVLNVIACFIGVMAGFAIGMNEGIETLEHYLLQNEAQAYNGKLYRCFKVRSK